MPARSLTSSNRERNAPSISLSEQDGTHFLNSLSEKYLLIVYRLLFESAYLYYLCHCSKLTELLYYLVKYQREAAILNDAVSATNTNDLKPLNSICFDFKLYVPNSYNKYVYQYIISRYSTSLPCVVSPTPSFAFAPILTQVIFLFVLSSTTTSNACSLIVPTVLI